MFKKHRLGSILNCCREEYFRAYTDTTNLLWKAYDNKEISKETLRRERLRLVFQKFNKRDSSLENLLESDYLQICPKSPHLIEGTKNILSYLSPKYNLYLLTNGFKEIQFTKISTTQIDHYFKEVVTSEDSGHCKPHHESYAFLHQKIDDDKSSCLMIGDNKESDIEGANSFGYDSVYFSPRQHKSSKATYTISHLSQLKRLI